MRNVGLMLALAGPFCPVAATRATAEEGPAAARSPATGAASPLLEAERKLLAETSVPPGRVEPVGFQAPSRSADPGGSDQLRSPNRRGSIFPSGASKSTLPGPGSAAPIPLGPRSRAKELGGPEGVARGGGLPSLVTVGSSLALVLGLFLIVAWLMRRTVPGGTVVLPGEVLEVLGRAALAGRAQVHLVRCGNKLLLVSLSTAGVETLTEVTDPDEVTRLVGLCRQAQPGSTTAAFRQMLQQLAGSRPALGGSGPDEHVRLAKAGMPQRRDVAWEDHDV